MPDADAPARAVAAVRDRIAAHRAAHGGDDHVWISLTSAEDLDARAAELSAIARELRGPRGSGELPGLPLFGVPFAVKDNIDTLGLPTTAACPEFARLPGANAVAVQRLLDAGAIMVGKTNLDQFATGLSGTRSPYGAPRSVFGGNLISGGSSSGSAVAVAAGLVPFALGTDTAGSGRVPAALNGIVGLKPTRGLVSTTGVLPACRSLDCVSVFARTVRDADAVLRVIEGFDVTDPWSRRAPGGTAVPPAGAVRIGVPSLSDEDYFGDVAIRRCVDAARDRAARLSGGPVRVDIAPLLAAGELLYGPFVAERLTGLGDFVAAHPGALHPVTRRVLAGAEDYDATDAFRAQHRLAELRRATDLLWDAVDLLVLPTVGTTFTVRQLQEDPLRRNGMLGRYTHFANLLDLAVVSVPAGTTPDGRPAGLSLLGPAFSDRLLAEFAARLCGEDADPDRPHRSSAPRAGGTG